MDRDLACDGLGHPASRVGLLSRVDIRQIIEPQSIARLQLHHHLR